MKILHIMAARSKGGAETYALDVMLSLHAEGVDQVVVMAPGAPRLEALRSAGIKVTTTPLVFPFGPLQRFLMTRLIARKKPDVIHCWMRRAASLVSEKSRDGRKVIGWFGGYYDPRRFGVCTHFVGVTKDIVGHMVQNGVSEADAFFIPTFPDITMLSPVDRATLATPKNAKVLLTLSRLHPKKGLDTFLRSVAELPGCYAWLAGDGPLQKELEAQAMQLNILDRVRFLGWRTDRGALLRAADLCVLPSRYEPFGTVILEAWAAGVPLVACRAAGPAAHIVDEVDGILVPVDDDKGLTAALRRVLDDEDLRRRLIANGYASYIKGYTREAVTQQWVALYRKLAEQ